MHDDPSDEMEDQQARQLAAWDQALEAGSDPRLDSPSSESGGSPNLSFLKFLRQHWPRDEVALDTGTIRQDDTGVGTDPGMPLADVELSLGRFQVIRELGRGGFGVVFLAFDSALQRHVALKVPSTLTGPDRQLRERFQVEARAAAGLDHPNIVPVFDTGEDASICYIASAYCPGISLAQWLRARHEPVPFRDGAQLVAVLASGVEHAHRRGVLHRDLKPGNVLLTDELHEAEGPARVDFDWDQIATCPLGSLTPRITDFGLARLLNTDGSSTQSGAVLGTPSYMAPEQAHGRVHDFGPPTDVYALGAILYELLTGRPPFEGDTQLDILIQAKSAEPVSPSRIRPRTPRDLEIICIKCLQKESRRRYATAEDLRADLNRFLHNQPIVARPVGPIGRCWRWSRRNQLAAGLSVTLLAVVSTSLVVLTVLLWLAIERQQLAEFHSGEATRQRVRSEQSYRMARTALASAVGKVVNDPRVRTGELEDLRRTVQEIEAGFYREFLELKGEEPTFQLERGKALRELGLVVGQLGKGAEAQKAMAQSVAALEALVGQDSNNTEYKIALYKSLLTYGNSLMRAGQLDRAEVLLERARTGFERWRQWAPQDQSAMSNLANTLSNLGMLHGFLVGLARENESARPQLAATAAGYYDQASAMLSQLAEVDFDAAQFAHGTVMINKANLLLELKQLDSAEQAAKQALQHYSAVPEDHAKRNDARMMVAGSQNTLGVVYSEMGRSDDERRVFAEALVILQEFYEEHPLMAQYAIRYGNQLSNIGASLRDGGELEEAIDYFVRAIDVLQPLLDRDSNDMGAREFLRNAHKGMGEAHTQLGRHDIALIHWDRTLAMDSGQYINWFSFQKARTLARLGQIDGALDLTEYRLAETPDPRPQVLYDAACVCAVAAASEGVDAERSERLCVRAIELLRGAVEKQFDKPHELVENPDLKILRGRPDFQAIVGS